MGWSLGNTAHSAQGTNVTNTVTITVSTGDLIVVFATTNGGQSSATWAWADTNLNTYLTEKAVVSDRPSVQAITGAVSNGSGSITITVTSNRIVEWIHVATFTNTGTIPGTIDSFGSGVSTQTTTFTTTVNNVLLVGFGDASTSNSAGSGYTAIFQDAGSVRVTSEYETDFTNTAGSNTVALVQGTQRSILGVAFTPPSGATGKLFRDANLSGLQGGGPFFVNPLG